MTENFINHTFNSTQIDQRIVDGYVNLNQMANAVDKRIDNWLRLQETTSLLREFTESTDYTGIQPIVTLEGRNGGTWAHPDIAIQFAQWCSPAFALQVSRWIRQWMTDGRSPLADVDRVGLRDALKDDARLRMTDQVKKYLLDIQRYDDKKYRGLFFAKVHDAINMAVTGETSKAMNERLSVLLDRAVKEDELIRDYFPALIMQRYISMCETTANLIIRDELQPMTAVERASELVLPANYIPKPIDFVEHIKYVRDRLVKNIDVRRNDLYKRLADK